jgi:hypothetical protein
MTSNNFIDNHYPIIITPRLLELADNFVSDFFRKEFKKHQPDLYEWLWVEGESVEIGDGREGDFFDPINWWINRRYKIGTGRLRESIESSCTINWVDLGNGYRLHYAGFDPKTHKRAYKNVILLDFLYLQDTYRGPKTNDGTLRLKKWIEYVGEMAQNPYHTMILHPVGSDTLDYHSPHLKACGYVRTEHKTLDLIKIYKYWLKAKKLNLPTISGIDSYYKVECYQPKDPKFK